MGSTTTLTDTTTAEADPPGGAAMNTILQEIRDAIWQRRPILGDIMQKHGEKILYEYTKDFLDVNPIPHLDADKQEIIDCVYELTEERVGKGAADAVVKQLRYLPLVSTADHHAPIDHPFWVNANLITAIPYLERNDPLLTHLVVFSFASVSLNNQSGYPRGIQFYGGVNGSKNVLRIPVMPDKYKMSVVYGMRAFTKEDVANAKKTLHERAKKGEVAPEREEGIRNFLETFFENPDVLAAPSLSSQITKINYALWPQQFHPKKDAPVSEGPRVPDLLYLEIETIVTKMLLKRHLQDPKSLIYKAFFHPQYAPLVSTHFNNIPGAFSHERDWGTYFFWYIDDKHHRVRLYLKDGMLTSKEGRHTVPFTPEGLASALREGKIFPSMLTCYLMISLYYGFKCLGGFCQVNDLTMTKKAWQALLREVGNSEEADAIEPLQTKELGGDGMVLSYTRTVEGDLIPGSGIDMYLSNADTRVERYVERSKSVTLSEMMNPMLPEMYTVLYPAPDRDPRFTAVTPEEILAFTGLGEKLDRTFNP